MSVAVSLSGENPAGAVHSSTAAWLRSVFHVAIRAPFVAFSLHAHPQTYKYKPKNDDKEVS